VVGIVSVHVLEVFYSEFYEVRASMKKMHAPRKIPPSANKKSYAICIRLDFINCIGLLLMLLSSYPLWGMPIETANFSIGRIFVKNIDQFISAHRVPSREYAGQ
jgi:hypothetical protein